ncbi:MAG: hypothetical protein ACHQVK_04955, partial [Candidatus Paceibacterales bacterium]
SSRNNLKNKTMNLLADTLTTSHIAQTMTPLPLNVFIFVSFGLASLIKLLAPKWDFNWRMITSNFLVIFTAFAITQWWITATPSGIWGQLGYILACIAFSASPIEVWTWVTTDGLKAIKSWVGSSGSKFTKTNTTEVTQTTETSGTPPGEKKP